MRVHCYNVTKIKAGLNVMTIKIIIRFNSVFNCKNLKGQINLRFRNKYADNVLEILNL